MFDLTQCININDVPSDTKKLTVKLFCTICRPNQSNVIIHLFGLSYNSYADDTQLLVTITKDRERDVLGKIEKCVVEIKI